MLLEAGLGIARARTDVDPGDAWVPPAAGVSAELDHVDPRGHCNHPSTASRKCLCPGRSPAPPAVREGGGRRPEGWKLSPASSIRTSYGRPLVAASKRATGPSTGRYQG